MPERPDATQPLAAAREYERAESALYFEVAMGFVRLHPVLSQISFVPRDEPGGVVRMTHEGKPIDEPTITVEAAASMKNTAIRDSDIDAVVAHMHEVATEFVRGMAAQFYVSLDRITSATGQTVDARGKPFSWDLFIEILEMFPAQSVGSGQPQLIVPSGTLKALGVPTPEQKQRLEALEARKKQEHESRRRHRRLPR